MRPATAVLAAHPHRLHAGEALRDADDFYGKNVILASRIGSQARGLPYQYRRDQPADRP
jgi:hypothetical protein